MSLSELVEEVRVRFSRNIVFFSVAHRCQEPRSPSPRDSVEKMSKGEVTLSFFSSSILRALSQEALQSILCGVWASGLRTVAST